MTKADLHIESERDGTRYRGRVTLAGNPLRRVYASLCEAERCRLANDVRDKFAAMHGCDPRFVELDALPLGVVRVDVPVCRGYFIED